jgi:Tfp pilus assembly protein PilF
MPDYGRVHYNHGQVLLVLDQPEQAEAALLMALSTEPRNQDFFVALADYYLKSGQPEKARDLAINSLRQFPGHAAARELMQYLKE